MISRTYNVTESSREEMKSQVVKRIKVMNNGKNCRKIEFERRMLHRNSENIIQQYSHMSMVAMPMFGSYAHHLSVEHISVD